MADFFIIKVSLEKAVENGRTCSLQDDRLQYNLIICKMEWMIWKYALLWCADHVYSYSYYREREISG